MFLQVLPLPSEMPLPVKFPWPRREQLPESLLLFPRPLMIELPAEIDELEMDCEPERWDGLS